MKAVLFRTRVAMLWMAIAVALSGSMLLYIARPGAMEEMLAGEMEGELLTVGLGFQLALFIILPLVMMGVTLFTGDRANGYINLVVGALLGVFGGFMMVSEAAEIEFDAHLLMGGVAALIAFVIAGLSLVWLRSPAVSTPAPAVDQPRADAAV